MQPQGKNMQSVHTDNAEERMKNEYHMKISNVFLLDKMCKYAKMMNISIDMQNQIW